MEYFLLVLSLVILYFGAEWLVSGAASIAKRIGISELVIGLTIVSIGTSAPELVVSVKAALAGQSALSIGNVLGSNLFNMGIILGISAMIIPLAANKQLIRFDVPVMILTSLLFLVLFLDGSIQRWEAFIFIAMFLAYTIYILVKSKKEGDTSDEESAIKLHKHWAIDVLLLVVGFIGLVMGSNLLVDNAVIIAERLGMSEALIGLTIVAAGTSMPELATSVVAAMKKRADIAIGNVVGSNIFNILFILGVAGSIYPIQTPDIDLIDSLFVVGIGVLLWAFIRLKNSVSRFQGVLLLGVYVVYFIYKLTTM